MTQASIQGRLLLLVLLALLGVGLVTGLLGYRQAVHEVDELLDAQLGQYARTLLILTQDRDARSDDEAEDDDADTDDDDDDPPPAILGHRYESRLMYQVWLARQGQPSLMLRSPDAPAVWPAQAALQGYSEIRIADRPWRCFAIVDRDGERRVLVALDLYLRDDLAGHIAFNNMTPYLLGLPVLAVLLILAIRRGLAPLRRLEEEVVARSASCLDPLPTTSLPGELRPLGAAMNGLLERMRQALDNERRFTSDAAHELRTPLAALRMQLQVAERTPDPAERLAAIAKALKGTDRMTHLVSQLLALARLEGQGEAVAMASVDLTELAEEVAADLARGAAEKGVHLHGQLEAGVGLAGNPDLLRVLLRNLLDNALRYVPAGGRIELSLVREAGQARLRVADDGPGIPPEDRPSLGRRFNRFGRQDVEGVGLGLSIVRRVAELHRAELAFGEGLEGRGLGVEIRFPAASFGP